MRFRISNKIIIPILFLFVLGIAYIDYNKYLDINVKKETVKVSMVPYKGKVTVLNGCGKPGIASVFTKYLRKKGYKVYISENAKYWNYKKTEVLSLDGNMDFANRLGNELGCSYVYPYKIAKSFYNIRVIIGKDFNKYIKKWSLNNEL